MSTLLLLALIFFVFIAIFQEKWALFIILVALPSYLIRFQVGLIPFTFLEAMIIILFSVWFIKRRPWLRLKKSEWKIRHQKYPYYIEIIIILLAAWAGLAIAGFSNSALGIFKAYFIEPIMLYLIIIDKGQGSEKKLIWPLAISAFIISLVAIFQQITGAFIFNTFWAAIETRRVTSVFSYPNAVGLYLAPIFFLSGALFFSYPKKTKLLIALKKIFLLLSIASSLAAIVFARSEGALIGILGGLLIIGFLLNRKSRKITITVISLAIILLASYNPAWQYAQKKITLMDLSGQIRRQQWIETIEMLKDGKILGGAGLSNYQASVKPFHQEGIFVKNDDPNWHRLLVWNEEYRKKMWQPVEIYLYPHNIFLNFWTEIGLLGAIAFFWLIARYFYDGIKLLKTGNKRYLTIGLIGAMTALFIHGLVDVPYFKNDLSIIFWLLIALMGILKLKNKQKI